MTPDSESLHKIANTAKQDRLADIVFIHGLCGASHSTWRHGKEGKPGHFFWPEELGKDLPNYGIWSVGYPAGLTELGKPGMIIEKRAGNIALKLANGGLGDRPIFFVAHSMGGLVVKSLIVGSQTLPDRDRIDIVDRVRGIVFCGTPHRGSAFADAATVLGTFFGGSQDHVDEMRANAEPLDILHDEFVEWHRRHPVPVESYAENIGLFRKRWYFRPLPLGVVVPRASANPNIAGHTLHDVDYDHLSLVKPPNRQHEVYAGVLRFIQNAPLAEPVSPDSPTGQPRSGVVIPEPPEPYLAHPYPMQANFTGRVAERTELTNWFNDTGDPMFVYEAIGGMGKSAVTWYWLHEDVLKARLATDGVIWWSFYEDESRFEAFLEKALIYLTQDEEKVKAMPSMRERMEWLRQLLCKKRYLIILDGAERILRGYAGLGSPYQGDEVPADKKDEWRACVDPNAGTFLQWLTSVDIKSKILITSRLFPKELDGLGGCRHKLLDRMEKDDAVEFFRQQGIKGTHTEIETACERYGYHPLSLRLLSGMIVADPQYNRDIKTWTKYNPLSELKPKEHDILELAYNSLNEAGQKLISELAAFRNPMAYDSMVVFQRDFGNQQQFDAALIDLGARGLLLRDPNSNKYDLHPIVRRYCYDRLRDKKGVHSQLRDYFAAIPEPDKVTCLEDLSPVIELYYHTVRAGQFDEAVRLLRDRLVPDPLHFQFGAYQLMIELDGALFPDGENCPPRLQTKRDQSWAANALASSYASFGKPRRAIALLSASAELDESENDKKNLAIDLGNLGSSQLAIGVLRAAEANLRRRIALSREIKNEFQEAIGQLDLGRLLACCGFCAESEIELTSSEIVFDKQGPGLTNYVSVVRCYRAWCELLRLRSPSQFAVGNPQTVTDSARRALELTDETARRRSPVERDYVRAHWLLGAAHRVAGQTDEAEDHLREALKRCHRINMVDHEADIRIDLARLRAATEQPGEAKQFADEALVITERSGYVLQGADAHLELAKLALARGDKTSALEHAKEARKLATCDGPPDYTYKVAYDEAGALLDKLEHE